MGGIFISYRRDDVAGQVGRLFGRLTAHYGEEFVFMDVESIRPSQEFEAIIETRIRDCDVMLLAIGPRWEAQRAESKGAKDFVSLELAAALGAKRPLWPLLIDRHEPPAAAALPEPFQQVLGRQVMEIRHSTFDTDVGVLISELEAQGVRAPASLGRQRVELALAAAGWPYTWFAGISRTLRPVGAAALAAVVLAAAAWLIHGRGVTTGYTQGRDQAAASCVTEVQKKTEEYEGEFAKLSRASLRINGLVTDGSKGVEDAEITLTNKTNGLKVTDKTDSRGVYNVDLEKLEVAENDVIRFEVIKPSFKPTVENIKYYDGFREFRAVLRK